VIKPQPAILLTEPRTGGTFLAGCLSNHTDVFCARGEPFHRGSRWGVACQDEVERLVAFLRLTDFASYVEAPAEESQ